MPPRPLSQRVIKAKQRRLKNAQLAEAVDMYEQEQQKPDRRKRKTRQRICAETGVVERTLRRHLKGGVTISAFNAKKQFLTPAEERILVDFIVESADRGCPPTPAEVKQAAAEIASARTPDAIEPKKPGVNWVARFLDRHRDELQTHWSRPLDTIRARSLNPATVEHWFQHVVGRQYHGKFKPEHTYGTDESGCPPQATVAQHVIGRRGTKVQHKQGAANRENVTVLVTICADGSALCPLIIFKAKNFQKAWNHENPVNAS